MGKGRAAVAASSSSRAKDNMEEETSELQDLGACLRLVLVFGVGLINAAVADDRMIDCLGMHCLWSAQQARWRSRWRSS